MIFPTATNNFNIESLRGQSVAKMLRDTVQNVQSDIGKRLYEICLKGHLPTSEQILYPSDLIELKKCIYASQVKVVFFFFVFCIFIYFSFFSLAFILTTYMYT